MCDKFLKDYRVESKSYSTFVIGSWFHSLRISASNFYSAASSGSAVMISTLVSVLSCYYEPFLFQKVSWNSQGVLLSYFFNILMTCPVSFFLFLSICRTSFLLYNSNSNACSTLRHILCEGEKQFNNQSIYRDISLMNVIASFFEN